MSLMRDLLGTLFERRYRAAGRPDRDARPIESLCRDLTSSRGEVSGFALARRILDRYATFDEAAKRGFFAFLNTGMDVDPDALATATEAYRAAPSQESYRALMHAAEPERQELTRRLNQVPGATGHLVAMRADLLRLAREDPALAKVDLDFRHLFASWFNRGFLVLRPISWETPAHILEKIIAYEAVHAIDSWQDLRNRLQPGDRRCFAFFHPAMPDEPLIFVEVALTTGVAGSIQQVLADERATVAPGEADTAVFYSISNCQKGLAGISFGSFMIKQVVDDLSRELAQLKNFVTLSPLPKLNEWLEETGLADRAKGPENLRRMAARYLLEAKGEDGLPRDPVARFHLGNGALVHDVHAEADLSAAGKARSGGAMVNYRYDLGRIPDNHERFASSHVVIASSEVRGLARQARSERQKGAEKDGQPSA